jgi:very-short-patch-repair endonuclease
MTEETKCSDKKLCDKDDCKKCFEKSFASHEKAKFWSNKNELKPRQVSRGSEKKIIFNCNICNHEFEQIPYSITSKNGWCSYCANQKICLNKECNICFEKSFASYEKSKYWSIKNHVNPRHVFKASGKKYLFDCVCGHEFEKELNNIVSNNGWCPFCSSPPQKLCDKEDCKVCFERSFASHEKAKYWNIKNELQPRFVFKISAKKYIFDCDKCNHSFTRGLAQINEKQHCPYCVIPSKLLCDNKDCKKCFERSFASHEKAKYWSNKNELKPIQVFKSSIEKYIFNCSCGHEFNQSLSAINSGKWCSYCCSPPKLLCEKEDCEKCFEKSFASHEKAKYWSNKNKLKPIQVFRNSHDKYIFNCDKCDHTFEKDMNHISGRNGWCPYCCNQKLCENKKCEMCLSKTFASSEKAKYWSEKNKLKPNQVFLNANSKYIFNCNCGHEFEQVLGSTAQGAWCHYCCSPPLKLCDKEDCKECFKKSFASHKDVKYWSNKNKEKPRNIFLNCNSKFIFNCSKGHEYEQLLCSKSRGNGCPFCINKTEQKLFDQLIKLYPTLQQQFKVSWCKKKTYLPFDFLIPEHNIIIELDGPQHFIQISNWSSPEEQNINDKYKMGCANKNKYSVIRLTQEDVFYDTYNWLDELNQNIKKIIDEKIIQNIYMCKNNEYSVFDNQSDCIEV